MRKKLFFLSQCFSPFSKCMLILILLSLALKDCNTQILFPPISDRGRGIEVQATGSCGLSVAEVFCSFDAISDVNPYDYLEPNCMNATCDNTCPFGNTSPTPINLETGSNMSNIVLVSPAPGQLGTSLRFNGQSTVSRDDILDISSITGFSFATWIYTNNSNGYIISRMSSSNEESYSLQVLSNRLVFTYLSITGTSQLITTLSNFPINFGTWYHLVLTVFQQDAALYVDGIIQLVILLEANIKTPATILYLGEKFDGTGGFTGDLDNPSYYNQVLTAREVYESYFGTMPFVHFVPECRCPPSHPIIAVNQRQCSQHVNQLLVDRGTVDRVRDSAHHPSFSNDNTTGTAWVSMLDTNTQNITYILSDNLVEIVYILIALASPPPKALTILKSTDNGATFTPMHYFSDDCLGYFNMSANQPILTTTSVICTNSLITRFPLSGTFIFLNLLDTARVQLGSLNNDENYRNFLAVNQIRFSLQDFFTANTTSQHRYYSISHISMAVRCLCNGHAESCLNAEISTSCVCQHNTQGIHCEQCQPLFNDKLWVFGSPCKECSCNNHATSCLYDPALDLDPLERFSDGGGVCQNCLHDTEGRYCDQCIEGYYRNSSKQISEIDACVNCQCNSNGISDQGLCDTNGQCNCKTNVEGLTCNSCKIGYYLLSANNPDGCSECGCQTLGTELASTDCDIFTGQCRCKANVEGLKCDTCKANYANLQNTNPSGCVDCGCNPVGSVSSICNPINSSCVCNPGVTGTRCSQCQQDFHSFSINGCSPCNCNLLGSTGTDCSTVDGQCVCKANTTGITCESCKDGFYNLLQSNPNGCDACSCNVAGSVVVTCDQISGQCQCKQNVMGVKCDTCKQGFGFLSENDALGCSSIPTGVNRPTLTALSSSSVLIEWSSATSTTTILNYLLHRNDTEIVSISNGFTHTDTSLFPYTVYLYTVTAVNNAGSTRSDAVSITTLEDRPSGVSPVTITNINSRAITVSWILPSQPNGNIISYMVYAISSSSGDSSYSFTGTTFSSTISGLEPFTVYSILVSACTTPGCTNSTGIVVLTQEAAPELLSSPTISNLASTSLSVLISPPAKPNGILTGYTILQRVDPFTGPGTSVSTVSNSTLTVSVTSLAPFTQYEFAVVATTNGGSATSDFTRITTADSVPIGLQDPTVSVTNATSLEVRIIAPTTPNSATLEYILIKTDPLPVSIVLTTTVTGVYSIIGLTPFTSYSFLLQVCNSAGCANSSIVTEITSSIAPEGQYPPTINEMTSSSISLSLLPPTKPNGVITSYRLSRTYPAILPTDSPALHQKGIRFHGAGYILLQNSVFVGGLSSEIIFDIKTFATEGLIFFATTQSFSDYFAITFNSSHLQFIFDAGLTSVVTLMATDIHDGLWHTISVSRSGNSGTLTVDGILIATSNGGGADNDIAQSNFVYLGGISGDITSINHLQLLSILPISGCIRDLAIDSTTINTNHTLESYRTTLSLEGCPSIGTIESGIHLPGTGFAAFSTSELAFNGDDFQFTFDLRTNEPNGTILVVGIDSNDINTDFLLFSILSGFPKLFIRINGDSMTLEIVNLVKILCDNEWHFIHLSKVSEIITLTVDNQSNFLSLPSSQSILQSNVIYFGGVDILSPFHNKLSQPSLSLHPITSFGGCIRNLYIDNTPLFSYKVITITNIDFDGCRTGITLVNCTARPITTLSDGNTIQYLDTTGLQPFQEYYYRSTSINSEGAASSNWIRAFTLAGVPSPPNTLQLSAESSTSISVSLTHPTFANGVVDNYVITFITTGSPNIIALVDSKYTSYIQTNLTPFTSYTVLAASQLTTGILSATIFDVITTLPSVPSGIQTPLASDITAQTVTLSWSSPTTPNGDIQNYSLYRQSDLSAPLYSGSATILSTTLTTLVPFTSYNIVLQACTSGGCGISSPAIFSTAEALPENIEQPSLLVLDSKRILVIWTVPTTPNGIILSYDVIYSPVSSPNNLTTISQIAATEREYTVLGLTPATEYQFAVRAINSVGGVISGYSTNYTLTDAPEGVSPPAISSVSANNLTISWQPPVTPNGDIIQYRLLISDRPQPIPFDGQTFNYTLSGLIPFTPYDLRVQACTISGCGTSDLTRITTSEASPTGLTPPTLVSVQSTSVELLFTIASMENGIVTYELFVVGVFSGGTGQQEERIVYANTVVPGKSVNVADLLPFTLYSTYVNASNSVARIQSGSFTFRTDGSAPESFSAPTVLSTTSTSITLRWQPPGIANGNISHYDAYASVQNFIIGPVRVNIGDLLMVLFSNLRPATIYSLYVVAFNQFANVTSGVTQHQTDDGIPADQPAPEISRLTSSSLRLSWLPPTTPNGNLIAYNIIQNSTQISNVAAGVTVTDISNLTPFTVYVFSIEACTSAGCFRGNNATTMTMQDVPEGLAPPILSTSSPTTVVIRWSSPTAPNGILLYYHIERRLPSGTPLNRIVTLNVSSSLNLVYIDQNDTFLKPYLEVEYRLVVENSVGTATSSFISIVTQQAAPGGLATPVISDVQPRSFIVRWIPPSMENGILNLYSLGYYVSSTPNLIQTISLPPTTLNYSIESLLPFTSYSVTITACTSGGCTESDIATQLTTETEPSGYSPVTGLSETPYSILISWNAPSMPNGAIIRYILTQLNLNTSISTQVFSGLELSFNATNLLPFTQYQFSLTIENGAGIFNTGQTAEVRTLAAPPLSGAVLSIFVNSSSEIQLTWVPPPLSLLRGEVINYTVRGYPVGNPAMETTYFIGLSLSVLITNLSPSVEYTFIVILETIAGSADSNQVVGTTLDGAPQGVFPPTLYLINSTAIRATWRVPSEPGGVIVSYSLIIMQTITLYTDTSVGSYVITNLLPFTNYSVQISVCTQFDCTISTPSYIITAEAPPSGLQAVNTIGIGSTYITVSWPPPSSPNGIILQYRLLLKQPIPCSQSTEQDICDYVECPLGMSQCGYNCYTPSTTICCNGALYSILADHACCVSNYSMRVSSTDVCCAGVFYSFNSQYSCCGGSYQALPPDSVCCENADGNFIGTGDSCCGLTPFSSQGSECCGGVVVQVHSNTMCCGGSVESAINRVCCAGVSYSTLEGYACCGNFYAAINTSLCCTAYNGASQLISYSSALAKIEGEQICCGSNTIHSNLSCCNNRGFNPSIEECSDRSTSTTHNCGTGITCPISQSMSAYCNRCDFDITAATCSFVDLTSSSVNQVCFTTDEIFQGLALTYNITNLSPFTTYQLYIEVINSGGSAINPEIEVITLESSPNFVELPTLSFISATSIFISWNIPQTPNGVIIEYRLYQDTVLIMNTSEMTSNITNLIPFTEYIFSIAACTSVGCTISMTVSTTTLQAIPQGVATPYATSVTHNSIVLVWDTPTFPNGIIQYYVLLDAQGTLLINVSLLNAQFTSLQPFIVYIFTLQACNDIGCNIGLPYMVITLEAMPQNMNPPVLRLISVNQLDISWTPPQQPNGIILYYLIRRDDIRILNTSTLMYSDTNILPHTTYYYTVEAFNGVGSILSGAASLTTPDSTPTGVTPPFLTVLNHSAIYMQWNPPNRTNGILLYYDVYQSQIALTRITNVNNRQFLVTNLQPYTVYNFAIAACTPSGCALSNTSKARTNESSPSGLAPPSLDALTAISIQATWLPPTQPNGIIINYELKVAKDNLEITVPIPLGTFTTNISNLDPYTVYEVRVIAENSINTVISDISSVRTLETFPANFSAPILSNETSRTIEVYWIPPLYPNGIINSYDIYIRQITTPTNPTPTYRDPVLVASLLGTANQTFLSGLQPASTYELRIIANNSIGSTQSQWVAFTTNEDIPQGLQLLTSIPDPSGTSLQIFWTEPLEPNGLITRYDLYFNSLIVFSGIVTTYTQTQLIPFSQYMFQLYACTSVGCSPGLIQNFSTAEIFPADQPSPSLLSLGATSISISWEGPISPNGEIIIYNITRNSSNDMIGNLIHSTINVTNRQYIDTMLNPYTVYSYAITAENSVGYIMGGYANQRTDEGTPSDFAGPSVNPFSSTMMVILWTPPTMPNGVIVSYEIFRNGVEITATLPTVFNYIDNNLSPFTFYGYVIRVCNSLECVDSNETSNRTLEDIPSDTPAPTLIAISFSAMNVTFSPPITPNGVIIRYMIQVNDLILNETVTPFTHIIQNLSPYTIYDIRIIACTKVGCSVGGLISNVRTLESIPSGLTAPTFGVISPRSVQINWEIPSMPNGVITSYDLLRNNSLILRANATVRTFSDANLQPAIIYTYQIQAYTSIGRSNTSLPGFVITSSDAPQLLDPPTLRNLSSYSFEATWTPPEIPNGVISRYELVVNDDVIIVNISFLYIVTNLIPFTTYSVKIRACTTSCTDSLVAMVTTNPDIPTGLSPPLLTPIRGIFGPVIQLSWSLPVNPNGIISNFEIYRREISNQTSLSFSVEKLIFRVNGTIFSGVDESSDLEPFTFYQYNVVAINSVGSETSAWVTVWTVEGIPEMVQPPNFISHTPVTLTVRIVVPLKPNGIIIKYFIFRNGEQVSEISANQNETSTIVGLQPYTEYNIHASACTAVGCNTSGLVIYRTGETTPEGVPVPTVVSITPTEVMMSWSPPVMPNGIIISYKLFAQTICPQLPQPHISSDFCVVGPLTEVYSGSADSTNGIVSPLLPYTVYQVFLQAENSINTALSTSARSVTTHATDPEVVGMLAIRKLCNTVTIDWSDTFRLNGLLKSFRYSRNEVFITNFISTTYTESNLTYNTPYHFKVQVITSIGTVENTEFVFIQASSECVEPTVTPSTDTTIPTISTNATAVSISQIDFIILISVTTLVILFIFIAVVMFFVVISFSRVQRDKFRPSITSPFIPVFYSNNDLLGQPISDLTLQESLMVGNRSIYTDADTLKLLHTSGSLSYGSPSNIPINGGPSIKSDVPSTATHFSRSDNEEISFIDTRL